MERQGRVLIVDDLEKWRTTLVTALRREGFYADSASTALEAINRLEETFYHVLVLDIQLDDSDSSNADGMILLQDIGQRRLSEAIQIISFQYMTRKSM